MSPPDAVRVDVVADEVRQVDQRGRPLGRGRTGRCLLEQRGSVRTRSSTVSRAGGRPTASPVSSGGASPGPFTAPYWPMSRPAVSSAAAAVHSFSSEISASRLVVVTSKAAKCSRSWAGGDDPGLVRSVEVDRAGGVGCLRLFAGQRRVSGVPGDAGRDRGSRRAEQAAAGDALPSSASFLRDHSGDLADRLGQPVDDPAELLLLRLGHVVGLEAVALAVLVDRREDGLEVGVQRGDERRVPLPAGPDAAPGSRPANPRRWPGSPTGRCASSGPPHR